MYVDLLMAYFPDMAGHLIAASVMSAPAALVVAKLMYPEDGKPETSENLEASIETSDVNVIDAAARGASEGLFMALNVGALLLAFIALIALANGVGGWAGGLTSDCRGLLRRGGVLTASLQLLEQRDQLLLVGSDDGFLLLLAQIRKELLEAG